MTAPQGGVQLIEHPFGFVDPAYGGWSPYAIESGNLKIMMRKATDVGVVLLNQYTAQPVPWVTGMLLGRWRFDQRFGVFEARMQMPSGANMLPAFWLFPADVSWPPEIYTEGLPNGQVRFGTVTDGPLRVQNDYSMGDLSSAMHDWTVVWRSDRTWLYIDGVLAGVQDLTGRPISEEMFLILSFGLLGTPDGATPTNADMLIESVRGWQFV